VLLWLGVGVAEPDGDVVALGVPVLDRDGVDVQLEVRVCEAVSDCDPVASWDADIVWERVLRCERVSDWVGDDVWDVVVVEEGVWL
jgi:hypothetical protein